MVDCLPKIALLIEQADADNWNTEIAARLELITRYIAESARVYRQCLADSELHTEVCDVSKRRARMRKLEPSGRPRIEAPG